MERISELNLRNTSNGTRKTLEIEDSFARQQLDSKATVEELNTTVNNLKTKITKNSEDISGLSDIVSSNINSGKINELTDEAIDEIWSSVFE